jgi:hypothetical protein
MLNERASAGEVIAPLFRFDPARRASRARSIGHCLDPVCPEAGDPLAHGRGMAAELPSPLGWPKAVPTADNYPCPADPIARDMPALGQLPNLALFRGIPGSTGARPSPGPVEPARELVAPALADDAPELLGQLGHRRRVGVLGEQLVQGGPVCDLQLSALADEPPADPPRRLAARRACADHLAHDLFIRARLLPAQLGQRGRHDRALPLEAPLGELAQELAAIPTSFVPARLQVGPMRVEEAGAPGPRGLLREAVGPDVLVGRLAIDLQRGGDAPGGEALPMQGQHRLVALESASAPTMTLRLVARPVRCWYPFRARRGLFACSLRREIPVDAPEELLDGVAQVLQQMPAVRDLFRVRGSLAPSIGEYPSPVAADDLDARMGHEPVAGGLGRGLLQQIDDRVALQVDDNCAIGLPFPLCPVVHADHPPGRLLPRRRLAGQAPEGLRAGGHPESLPQARAPFAPIRERDVAEIGPKAPGPPSAGVGHPVETLREDPARTVRRPAEEAPGLDPKGDGHAVDRQVGQSAPVPGMDASGRSITGRATDMRRHRDERDDDRFLADDDRVQVKELVIGRGELLERRYGSLR